MTRAAWCAGFLMAAACSEPTTPGRNDRFSYADTMGGPPIVFHWTAAELPVRYYAPATSVLPALVRRHLGEWEAQFLYGEFRAVLVTDSTQADVIVAFLGAPPAAADPDTATIAPACDGVTSPVLNATVDTLELPLRVRLDWFPGYALGTVWACVDRVTGHELGHTLGLFNRTHAGTQPGDLMAPVPQVYRPGPRDRATVEVLYHTVRSVTPVR